MQHYESVRYQASSSNRRSARMTLMRRKYYWDPFCWIVLPIVTLMLCTEFYYIGKSKGRREATTAIWNTDHPVVTNCQACVPPTGVDHVWVKVKPGGEAFNPNEVGPMKSTTLKCDTCATIQQKSGDGGVNVAAVQGTVSIGSPLVSVCPPQ